MGTSGSLNHIYRTVWNQALGAMVAIAEISTARGKSGSQSGTCAGAAYINPLLHLRTTAFSMALALAWGAAPTLALANPAGGVAIQGQASFTTNGNNLLVTTQNGAGFNHSAINWQSFSIPTGSTTYFQQPNASSTSINRVVTNTPSLIFGTLGSNGNLVLVNQSGITVGAGAVVDTAGFTASALRMSDADALSGRLRFGDATATAGSVSVMGSVLARSGDVVLMGSSVDTGSSALVQAPNGSTVLAAGQQIEITGRGLEGIVMQVQAPIDSAVNLGTLKGDAVGIFAGTLTHSGLIQATTATLEGGKVVLKAAQRVEDSGVIAAFGTTGGVVDISAGVTSSPTAPGAVVQSGAIDVHGTVSSGGTVRIQTDALVSTASIDASGVTAGGAINVQASRQAISTSSAHYMADGASGKGGNILLSAKVSNFTSGSYSATGATGGAIVLAGDEIKLASTQLDASGTHGGGSIRVGGLEHGAPGFGAQGAVLVNSSNVYSNSQTNLKADALQDGSGGSLVLWADQNMRASGNLSARGGAISGNGGNAEVSGAASLGFSALANLSASHGNAGTLLLDPHNITVVAGAGGWTGLGGTTYLEIFDPTPGALEGFGGGTNVILPNGNIVVTSPNDSVMALNSGAAYLFSPTGSLVSTLVGSSASDQVGSGGISQFSNGNFFLVNSPNWTNGVSAASPGAVTWMNGTNGKLSTGTFGGTVDGTPGTGNSLVGSTTGDFGGSSIVQLAAGNALVGTPNWAVPATTVNGSPIPAVAQAGAVTWLNGLNGKLANGDTGGPISVANSLVGSAIYDQVGSGGITSGLTSGNIAIFSPNWGSGAGAVTWMNGTTGQLSTGDFGGVVTGGVPGPTPVPGNSLVGTLSTDNVGTLSFRTSSDGGTTMNGSSSQVGTSVWSGNLVVASTNWSNGAGAVTWMDGGTGALADTKTGGAVSNQNSLVGSNAGDRVGTIWTFPNYASNPNWISETSGLVDLGNGNFLVRSGQWGTTDVTSPFAGMGAVTWVSGGAGAKGTVTNLNSIVGSNAGDQVGAGVTNATTTDPGVRVLPNSNYVVISSNWGGGKGAVTWGDGANGTSGTVSATVAPGNASSLVGVATTDHIGSQSIQVQSFYWGGSNFIVKSPQFSSNAGAVTWMNGTTGQLSTGDFGGVLTGGVPGPTPVPGNSLIGSFSGDGVGGEVISLNNGHFMARTPLWNGVKGALTWMNGDTGDLSTSTVSVPVHGGAIDGASGTGNSLVGSSQYDMSGLPGQGAPAQQSVNQLGNGNLIIGTPQWTPGGIYWNAFGAVTWMNGATGKLSDLSTGGPIGTANSLVGASVGDQVGVRGGIGIVPLAGNVGGNNVYNVVIQSEFWNNTNTTATWAGAATWMNGTTGALVDGAHGGTISNTNSLVGTHANDRVSQIILPLSNGHYVVDSYVWGASVGSPYATSQEGAVTWGNGISGTVGNVDSTNSLIGANAGDNLGSTFYPYYGTEILGNNYLVRSNYGGFGSLTWVNGSNGHLLSYTTGPNIGGVVSASNSLVGLTSTDNVKASNLTQLWNGMVVLDNQYSDGGKGSVTWMDPTNGTMRDRGVVVPFVGNVSATNSLVGTKSDSVSVGGTGDRIGSGGVTEIADYATFSNYVISSPSWVNGTAEGAGAVTFASGSTGKVGTVSTSNSLVGTLDTDAVGSSGVYQVTDNTSFWNYFVHSPNWGSNKGAITWMNGQTGALTTGAITPSTGTVSELNSLVGATAGDLIGTISRNTSGPAAITSFGNGNLLVRSGFWAASPNALNASALTWMGGANGKLSDGSNGGAVSTSNSLLGSASNDNLAGGEIGLWELQVNRNWVITSPYWSGGMGAATWINSSNGHLADGTTGGYVSASNSLVGSTRFDSVGGDYYCDCQFGVGGITALSNGNYVVNSPNVSAITWGNGSAGVAGTISTANSAPVNSDQIWEYGATGMVLGGNSLSNSGKGGVYLVGAAGSTGTPTFATRPGGDATVGADWLASSLSLGTNLVLQANTDITVSALINVVAGNSAPGSLTLQAGRSIAINANISTGGGNVMLVANDTAARGVVDANRDAGPANLGVAAGVIVNAGTGSVSLQMLDGAGNTNRTIGTLSQGLGSSILASSLSVVSFGGADLSANNTVASFQASNSGIAGLKFNNVGSLVLGFPAGTGLVNSGGVIKVAASGNLSLVASPYGLLSSGASGDAIVLSAGGNFSDGGNTLATPNGRWLVYSTNPSLNTETANLLTASGFRQYAYAAGALPTQATGNGFIYTLAPLLTATLNGPLTRVYNGTTSYALTNTDFSVTGTSDVVTVAPLVGNFDNKNVGVATTVSATGMTVALATEAVSGARVYGYGFGTSPVTTSASISPAPITLTAPTISKAYDGGTSYTTQTADLTTLNGALFSSDTVSAATLLFADKNAGSGNKSVSFVGNPTISDGNGGANYTVTTNGNANSTITPLTQVTWATTQTSGNWSNPASWTGGLVPDGANVLAVSVLNGAAVTYDLTTPTTVQAINMTGSFTMSTGNLAVTGNLSTPNYTQTGGFLSGGSLTVSNSFSQSSGATIGMTGPVSITQANGNLVAGSITGSSIALQANSGGVAQLAGTGLTGRVTLSTTAGASLMDAANRVSGFAVADVVSGGVNTRSSGNIALKNNVGLTSGAALDVSGVSLASGNLSVENTGSVSNSGVIKVDGGNFEIKSHSPITVGNTVTASGNIVLAALTPDGTSNITLNGSMTSTGGGISIQAYNNFIQNSRLSAALGIDVSTIAGSLTFGPGAYSVGNPVTYMVNGASYMPPWIASTLSGGATDFVVAFLDQFQAVLDAQQLASIDDPLGLLQRGQEGIVVEGEICKP